MMRLERAMKASVPPVSLQPKGKEEEEKNTARRSFMRRPYVQILCSCQATAAPGKRNMPQAART